MQFKFVGIICALVNVTYGKFYKENITDFANCKVHYSRQETAYKTFYELSASHEAALSVDFHFSVLAISDAHILLAGREDVTAADPVYEIVIGAGGNSFSDIRRKQRGSVRVSYVKRDLLSAVDVRSFWIHIHKNGFVAVGKEGEEIAFMSFTDTELLDVKVFSFNTWANVEAKWFFDCPRISENATNSKMLRPPTQLERLRQDILNRNATHNEIVTVNVQLMSHFVSLNEKEAVINLKGRANFSWNFSNIKWNPANYSGLKSVLMQHGEIWHPYLIILNAIDIDHFEPFNGNVLIASYNGDVIWQPTFDMRAFCSMDGVENWPYDIHTCEIFIGTTIALNDAIHLQITSPGDTIHLSGTSFDSEWYIDEEPLITIYRTPNINYSIEKYIYFPQSIKLSFTIKRRATQYHAAFNTPLFVIAALMLLNFWISPFDYIKLAMVSAQLLLTSMGCIGLAIVLPAHREKIPLVVYRYSALMAANILNLIITIVVINLARNKQLYEPPHIISRIIKSAYVEKLLLLPELTPKTISLYPLAMERVRRRSLVQDVWIRLGTCIDRIAFFIYLSLTISLLIITNGTH